MSPPLLVALLVSATAAAAPTAGASQRDAAASKTAQTIAARAGGTVGFAAVHLPSGRTVTLNAATPLPTQSVFKLPIAIATLRQVDAGKLRLDQQITLGPADARAGPPGTLKVPAKLPLRALIDAMLIDSDNVGCDKLLGMLGGPAAVDADMRALGVKGMTIRFSELEMGAGKGDNTSTPAAMVALLGKLAGGELGLRPATAKYLEDTLVRVRTGPRRLKGALPAGTVVAHKTGTSGTSNGRTDATNDVGLVTLPDGSRVAIAVFVHASPADEATREATIAALAGLAYDTFTPSPPPPVTTR